MAFTEAGIQEALDGEGAGVRITSYIVGASATDVYVQNYNQTARKSGWTQIPNSTASDAAAELLIEASLNT